MINPYQNRSATNRAISTSERIMRYTATVTTSLGAFVWGRTTALQYLPDTWAASGWLAMAAGLAAAAVSAYLTDMMFGQLLQRVCYDQLAKRHPNLVKWQPAGYFRGLRTVEQWGFAAVLAGLLVFDGYTTLIIREPVANQARSQPIVSIDSLRGEIKGNQGEYMAGLRADSKARADEIAKTERGVEAANPALVRLRDDGNAWAASELAKKKKRATASMVKNRQAVEANIVTTDSTDAVYLKSRIAEAEVANGRAMSDTDRNRAVFSGMYLAFTIAPKLLSIILRVLMVITFLAYSHNFHPDLTGDGVVDYQDVEEYYRREREQAEQQRQQAATRRTHGGGSGAGPAFR